MLPEVMPFYEQQQCRECLLMPVYDAQEVPRVAVGEVLPSAGTRATTHRQHIAKHRMQHKPQLLLWNQLDQMRSQVLI